MVGIYYNTVPAGGSTAGLKGFAACIFGAHEHPGAIVGGLILGSSRTRPCSSSPGYRDVVAFVEYAGPRVHPQGPPRAKLRLV
jgi:branched-subunit amino acid ABC-type transport system permease component